MSIAVKTLINDGPGRFFGYEPGDALTPGPVIHLDVAVSPGDLTLEVAVAEAAFSVGNRMAADAWGQQWPADVRSMSVGDVVIIGEVALSCEGAGWKPVDAFHLAVSLDPEFAKVNSRGRSFRSDVG